MDFNVACVLFSQPIKLNADATANSIKTLRPSLGDFEVNAYGDNQTVFAVGEEVIAYTSIETGFPWDDLEGPCATSVMWRNAEDTLKDHQGHIIVSVGTHKEPIKASEMLTHATAAVLEAHPDALGVYWGNGTLIVPRDLFLDATKEMMPNIAPLPIWVDVRVGPITDQTSTGFTHGMEALGLMELETKYATESFTELRERLLSLMEYLVVNGLVIKDGHTIGESAEEKIRVRYMESLYGHENQVMRLEYEPESGSDKAAPTSKKAWWKFW